jgi:hypothetical protein
MFRRPFLSDEAAATLVVQANAKAAIAGAIASVTTEQCFNVEVVALNPISYILKSYTRNSRF